MKIRFNVRERAFPFDGTHEYSIAYPCAILPVNNFINSFMTFELIVPINYSVFVVKWP